MTDLSFRQPHQRQESLRRRLLVARDQGDQRVIALLEMQWVHRFGVASLQGAEAAPAAATKPWGPQTEQSSAVEPPARETPGLVSPSLALSEENALEKAPNEQEPLQQEAVLAQMDLEEVPDQAPMDSALNRFRSLLRDGFDSVSATVQPLPRNADPISTTNVTSKTEMERSELPPPPPPSLKRLRRWLPSDGRDLPKAS
ncbi:hypothetical protein [Synechococcus sp. BS55D]|uniref:hypothetical protein n=1 Tax=Synechococcus sp. BS55D TaxID=2055943 RepID=UPI0010406190|nr:hypothetical protein [Synechococcus sp. BS55D]